MNIDATTTSGRGAWTKALGLVGVVLAGCGSPATSDAGVTVDAAPVADADLASGPLLVEFLAPTLGTEVVGVRPADSPRICAFETTVRMRVRGEGAEDVPYVEVATSRTLGFYRIELHDTPEGRVGEETVLLGRLLDDEPPERIALAAALPSGTEIAATSGVLAASCQPLE